MKAKSILDILRGYTESVLGYDRFLVSFLFLVMVWLALSIGNTPEFWTQLKKNEPI